MLVSLLYVLMLIALVVSQPSNTSNCKSGSKDLNVEKFLSGKWIVYKQFKDSKAKAGMKCKTLDFSHNLTALFDFQLNSNSYSIPGKVQIESASRGVIKASFDFSSSMGSLANGETFWQLLSTDYDNYAIVTTCKGQSLLDSELLFVVARSAARIPVIEDALKNPKILGRENLILENLTDCSLNNLKKGGPTLEENIRRVLYDISSTDDGKETLLSQTPINFQVTGNEVKVILKPESSSMNLLPKFYSRLFTPRVLPNYSTKYIYEKEVNKDLELVDIVIDLDKLNEDMKNVDVVEKVELDFNEQVSKVVKKLHSVYQTESSVDQSNISDNFSVVKDINNSELTPVTDEKTSTNSQSEIETIREVLRSTFKFP